MSLREQLNNAKSQSSSGAGSSLEASVLLTAGINKITQKMEHYDELLRTFYKVISSRHVNPERVSRVLESMAALRGDLQKAVTRLLQNNKKSVPVRRQLYLAYTTHTHTHDVHVFVLL